MATPINDLSSEHARDGRLKGCMYDGSNCFVGADNKEKFTVLLSSFLDRS